MTEDMHSKAVETWSAASPQIDPAQQAAHDNWEATQAAHELAESERWKWGWSRWIGIHYGPIPVGLIIGLPIMIAMWSSR